MKNIKNRVTNMNSQFAFWLLPFTFCLIMSCGEKKAEEAHEEEKSETEVALTAAQFKTVGIETGTIEMRNLNTVIKANGYTAVPPQNRADISTLLSG
ncbi:MAG TPA: hypothetical protein VI621_13180, partial [Flavobacterium sp.]|nr:hypothetical protein [Flavobacterium sp.]